MSMVDRRGKAADPGPAQLEAAALRGSIVATAVLGLMGVAWGVVSGSLASLLDGAYCATGIAVT